MFERLKALYDSKRITKAKLDLAVERNWITEMQLNNILGM